MSYVDGYLLCSPEFWTQYQKKNPAANIQRSAQDCIPDLQVLEGHRMEDRDVLKFAEKMFDVLAYCRKSLLSAFREISSSQRSQDREHHDA